MVRDSSVDVERCGTSRIHGEERRRAYWVGYHDLTDSFFVGLGEDDLRTLCESSLRRVLS